MNWAVGQAWDKLETQADALGSVHLNEHTRSLAFQAMSEPANVGNAVHSAVDEFNRNLPLELNDVTAPYVAHYASALQRENIVVMHSEKYVVNTTIGFGGTYDSLVGIYDNDKDEMIERGILDVKTGKEKKSQRLQLTGLSMGEWHGEAGLEPEPMPGLDSVGWILLLRPDGYELIRHDITDADREHFVNLVKAYHQIRQWQEGNMNRTDLFKEIADHHYALADLFQQLAGESATASVSAAGPAAASPAAASATQPEGGLEVCPKHRVPYTDGQYGPYCKQQTDEPAWGKQKGDRLWCRITPANAAEYLRIKAAA